MEFVTRINYIHAEKISEHIVPNMNINIQLSVPSSKPIITDNEVAINFTLTVNTTPPIYEIVIKGKTRIKGKKEELEKIKKALKERKNIPLLMQTITSTAIFEAALLARELGFPPILPIPSKNKSSGPPMGLQPI